MSDKLKCLIEDTNNNKTHCEIHFEVNLAVTDMSDYLIDTHLISENTISVTEPNNKLIDKNISNRYIFLFNGSSSYSSIEFCIYYDIVDEIMFIINNIDYLNIKNLNNQFINLYGYKIGSVNDATSSGLYVTNKLSTVKTPAPVNTLIEVDIIQLNLHGIKTKFSFNEHKQLDLDTNGYLFINLNTFIKVDKNILFGTDAKIKMHTIQPSSMTKFNTKYVGNLNTDYIYIPIPV